MTGKYFILFSNCIVVDGVRTSIIYDLQREETLQIPKLLSEILSISKRETVKTIKKIYKHEYDEGIDIYFKFLLEKELGFYTDDPDFYPNLDLQWDYPAKITNAIMDLDKNSDYNYSSFIDQINELGCHALEIRIYDEIEVQKLQKIIDSLQESRIRSISLLIKYQSEFSKENMISFYNSNQRIKLIKIHSSLQEIIYKTPEDNLFELIYTKKKICSHENCGQISSISNNINIFQFAESINYNSCLNRKISIDINGKIKQCPSMSREFGNIDNNKLSNIIKLKEFREIWGIKKDDIKVCKDCQYRHMCIDCRAYINDDSDIYSKPLKCSYNPYTDEEFNHQ